MLIEFEYWWLLILPLFFGLGWAAARIDLKDLLHHSRRLPAAYFRGLNLLVNEEPAKAVQAFQEVMHDHAWAVDWSMALGQLFRRQGDIEQAIKLHQALIDRQDVSTEVREAATFELAQDYYKAGFFDRAEQALQRLVAPGSGGREPALRLLLNIYQQERNWLSALSTAQAIDQTGVSLQVEMAHFHCELAEQALAHAQEDSAQVSLQNALRKHRGCVRALMLQAEVARRHQQLETALALWQQIEIINPHYLGLVLDDVVQAYIQLDKTVECQAWLLNLLGKYPALDWLHTLAADVRLPNHESEWRRASYTALRQHISLSNLRQFVEMRARHTPGGVEAADWLLMQQVVQALMKKYALHQCTSCGFKARQFYWQCPACARWETIQPERGETLPA